MQYKKIKPAEDVPDLSDDSDDEFPPELMINRPVKIVGAGTIKAMICLCIILILFLIITVITINIDSIKHMVHPGAVT